jgi:hypothetical protein
VHLQHIIEDQMEKVLDNHGYVFPEDGKSFHIFCTKCEVVPCICGQTTGNL